MNQKSLSNWIKGIILSMAVVGAITYFKILPLIVLEVLSRLQLMDYYFVWIIIISLTAIPCFATLIVGWMVANNIGKDKSFSKENAVLIKIVMILALIDSIFFFVANLIMYINKCSSPMIFTVSLILVFAGISIAIIAACLSHLILNAFELKEQTDLTI